jgi:hypothetical protein
MTSWPMYCCILNTCNVPQLDVLVTTHTHIYIYIKVHHVRSRFKCTIVIIIRTIHQILCYRKYFASIKQEVNH